MGDHGLSAPERIRSRPEFERIYSTGAKVHGRFMTVFVMPNGRPSPRFGVAATRRLGSAVERNRAKRRARELFRRRKTIGGFDIVIVPRREMLDAPFATLEADYNALLDRRRVPSTTTSRRAARPGRPGANQSV
jgi:ribonuclease P protein component